MIVVDASAVVASLLHDGLARQTLQPQQLHALHLADSEVAHVLRRLVAIGQISAADGGTLLRTWQSLAVTRYAAHGLLARIWTLRDNLAAYDAGYVALAEALGCTLVSADSRLSRAPGIHCSVTIVPR